MNATEKSINAQLDAIVKTITKNVTELISLARLGGKDRLNHSVDMIQIQYRTMNIVNAAQSITSLTSQLKQLLLMGDTGARHALLANRACQIDLVHANNIDALHLVLAESMDMANRLGACLLNHCAPYPVD